MDAGRLSSNLPEAKRALEIANATSYWTSVRKRVKDRTILEVENPVGSNWNVSMPEIIAHGTVTRRTVESLMVTMCSTKKHRIGTELKTRVECPDGWKIVGADFDGQELQIASIYADCMGRRLHWRKSDGSHHSVRFESRKELTLTPHLATAVGIDRDTAKGVGFAMLVWSRCSHYR